MKIDQNTQMYVEFDYVSYFNDIFEDEINGNNYLNLQHIIVN